MRDPGSTDARPALLRPPATLAGRQFRGYTEREMTQQARRISEALREALERQEDPEEHDRGLIVERLAWTPEQRLEANAAFLRFYFAVRPEGPLIREE
jgi:hypothetical protein